MLPVKTVATVTTFHKDLKSTQYQMEDANELCSCDDYKKIGIGFVPYSLGTINPYRLPMTRMDGSPCECDELPYSHLYNKQFRRGDKSCFDTDTTVKCK